MDYAFTLIPINDTLEGDLHIQALVENHHMSMNRLISRLGAGIESPVSSTDISLARAPLKETGIGNLIADAFRWAATHASSGSGRPCDVGIAASGTIRGDLFPGRLGIITLFDVYNILPLGLSPGTSRLPPGIPLISVYATAADIYAICETGLTIAPSLGPDYYLNFSGVRIDYDPSRASGLQGVKTVYLCPAQDPFCLSEGTPLDRSDKTRLYRVAVDLHTLQMIQTLHESSRPTVFPHPAECVGRASPSCRLSQLLRRAGPDPGLQEMKGWTALWKFLAAMFPAGGGNSRWPLRPGRHGAGQGPLHAVTLLSRPVLPQTQGGSRSGPPAFPVVHSGLQDVVCCLIGSYFSNRPGKEARKMAAQGYDSRLDKMFFPKSVAVVGASDVPAKWGNLILTSILGWRYRGRVFPVNPKKDTILGLKSYPSLKDIPEPVDLAVFTIPAPLIPEGLRDCAAKGIQAAVIVSSGFREAGGEGVRLEQEILAAAREGGVLFIAQYHGNLLCAPLLRMHARPHRAGPGRPCRHLPERQPRAAAHQVDRT